MITDIVSLDTALDVFFNGIDDENVPFNKVKYEKMAMHIACLLYSKCNSPLFPEFSTGIVKNNQVPKPNDFGRFEKLEIDGKPVLITMQFFLGSRVSTKYDSDSEAYKGVLNDDHIALNVLGGSLGLDGKKYVLNYKKVPFFNDLMLIPIEFVDVIATGLDLVYMKNKTLKTGKGVTLYQITYRDYHKKLEEVPIEVDMPSWDELLNIAKFWDSKVPPKMNFDNRNGFSKY